MVGGEGGWRATPRKADLVFSAAALLLPLRPVRPPRPMPPLMQRRVSPSPPPPPLLSPLPQPLTLASRPLPPAPFSSIPLTLHFIHIATLVISTPFSIPLALITLPPTFRCHSPVVPLNSHVTAHHGPFVLPRARIALVM